jgi:DNA mismatch repair ATPase MutL
MTEEIRRFEKEDIGGELLPILTTGLYRDALDTLREYIQNSIDTKAKRIELRVDPDQIVIDDDGVGMNKDDARKAIRLGISDKNPVQNVGFRGIGIYSAFNLCNSVEMFTKHKKDNTYKISFDFKKIREQILKEQERRKKNLKPELYLSTVGTSTVGTFVLNVHSQADILI